MKGTVADGYTKKIFSGEVLSYIRCINVLYDSKRTEDFYDIQLDVKGCRNIYESFDKYTSIEVLNGDNQYDAGIHGKQDAQKGVIFLTFPPVLTIHLKRFDFDFQTMGFTKIHDYFEFPQRLVLDKYIAHPDSLLLNGGVRLGRGRERGGEGRGGGGGDNNEEVDFLRERKEDFITEEEEEQQQQQQQHAASSSSASASNVYILHSVLVHQGDVGGGHYYAYIRPTTKHFDYSSSSSSTSKDMQWFRFNDEVVHQVKEREAIHQCYGRRVVEQEYYKGLSSAYMLVYIRESEAKELMRPIEEKDIPRDLVVRLDTEMRGELIT